MERYHTHILTRILWLWHRQAKYNLLSIQHQLVKDCLSLSLTVNTAKLWLWSSYCKKYVTIILSQNHFVLSLCHVNHFESAGCWVCCVTSLPTLFSESLRDFAILRFHKFKQIQGHPITANAGCNFLQENAFIEFLHCLWLTLFNSKSAFLENFWEFLLQMLFLAATTSQDRGVITIFRDSYRKLIKKTPQNQAIRWVNRRGCIYTNIGKTVIEEAPMWTGKCQKRPKLAKTYGL